MEEFLHAVDDLNFPKSEFAGASETSAQPLALLNLLSIAVLRSRSADLDQP